MSKNITALCLRSVLSTMLIGEAWGRMAQPTLLSFAWAQAYLPFPAVLGPLHLAARFVSGLLILAGFLTRPCGLFVAADMLGEIAIAKLPNSVGLVSWAREGAMLSVACALVALGAGSFSVDAALRRLYDRPARPGR